MNKNQKVLRRGLLGVRPGVVEQLRTEADATAGAAADEVRSAEERATASEARVAALEAQLARTHEDRSRAGASATDPRRLLQDVGNEMARLMGATQEAGSRIIEHARTDAGREFEESERRHREIEAERALLAGWIAELQQATPALHQGIVETAEALGRMTGAMQDTEQALARIFERMADAGAAIQRSRALSLEAAPPDVAKAEVVIDLADQRQTPSSGDVLRAPKPPVDVSTRVPWALRERGQSNGSHEESGEVSGPAPMARSGGDHQHDGDLAASRTAGPVADPRIHR